MENNELKRFRIKNRTCYYLTTELDVLYVYKVAWNIFFLTILQKSKLILMILCLFEKILTFHNVIIHIKLVLNKDKTHHYHKIFLAKCSYQLAKK